MKQHVRAIFSVLLLVAALVLSPNVAPYLILVAAWLNVPALGVWPIGGGRDGRRFVQAMLMLVGGDLILLVAMLPRIGLSVFAPEVFGWRISANWDWGYQKLWKIVVGKDVWEGPTTMPLPATQPYAVVGLKYREDWWWNRSEVQVVSRSSDGRRVLLRQLQFHLPFVRWVGWLAGVGVFYPIVFVGSMVWAGRRRARRLREGRCVQCGYDLRASFDRCPECGMAVPGDVVRKPIA